MKKLFKLLALLLATSNSYAQSILPNDPFQSNISKISVVENNLKLEHLDQFSENKSATHKTICFQLNNKLKQQNDYSLKFSNKNENPYKTRNIGIGFILGGALNAGAGAYIIYSFESDPKYWDVDVFFNNILGGGAIVMGGASILGGTIATVIGSIQGYKYANCKVKFKSTGPSIGLAYNF